MSASVTSRASSSDEIKSMPKRLEITLHFTLRMITRYTENCSWLPHQESNGCVDGMQVGFLHSEADTMG